MPRLGHRQGWRNRRRPHSPRLALGHTTRLPLRHSQLLGAPPRRRYRYRYRRRYRVLRRPWVLLGQGMRVHHMLVRTVMVMVMVKVDGVLWHSRRVLVMVKVDGELWHSRRVYVLVREVMLHHGEPNGVMN